MEQGESVNVDRLNELLGLRYTWDEITEVLGVSKWTAMDVAKRYGLIKTYDLRGMNGKLGVKKQELDCLDFMRQHEGRRLSGEDEDN